MRWFKCDFQLQTPEDSTNWLDVETKLSEPRRPASGPRKVEGSDRLDPSIPDESRLQETARTYLRRCHELGLEVVGITDHNFSAKLEPRDWFLTHLVEQNKSVAREFSRPPLFILPGFEVDIGYHVLCLFDPARQLSHVRRVHGILTRLGLVEGSRFRNGRPEPLRIAGESVSLKKLLNVVQDEHGGICIAAHADQNDGILCDARNIQDYHNLDLYAVEVTSLPLSKRASDILLAKSPEWARAGRQPAAVMSSDAKSLKTSKDGSAGPNCLGYRHTWVRMSKPSVTALRQAFLDPASRIRLLGPNPSDSHAHARIVSVSIKGARFMADQTIHFSENLNCVIGGRGSGKSTLLEYLRLALDSKQPDRGSLDPALEKKRQQIFASLRETSGEVQVEYETDRGVCDILLYSPASATPRQILSRAVDDVPTVLRRLQAQFFSQGELTRFTSDGAGRAKVREIVDSAAGSELEQLKQEELHLQSRLKRCFQAAQECRRLKGEIRSARQASVEIARQLEALTSVEAEAKASQAAVEADAFLKDLANRAEDELQAATNYVMSLSAPHLALPGTSATWPEIGWFTAALTALNEARAEFEKEAGDSLQRLKNQFQNILGDAARERPLAAIADARQNFRLACEAKGLAVENLTKFEELTHERQTKISFIDAREAELQTCSAEASALDETLRALQQLWRMQFDLRARVASALQSRVVSQSIRVRVAYMGDRQSFMDRWLALAPRDGRGKLARRWEELGSDIYQAWKSRQDLPSPWEVVEAGRGDPRALPYLYGEMADDLQPALLVYLDSADAREMWEAARGTRIDDEVDVDLFREDGSAAGNLLGTLSEGQRNTVLLNMILAMGNGPIIIDQPEDELDASFIYKSLVTDLRSAKEGRQLLIATHNANLPVNGDAEFILALEARDGRGMQRTLGGLDRRHVVQAVVDIMEGSEEAFRRRSDKYHF